VAKDLAELRNIGPTIENRLKEIGVRTRADLERVGAVNAYLRICADHANRTLPICYYLYSLQGALMDLHWDDLPEDLKEELRSQATGKIRRRARARR
jgi:DNA transformation protein and related proteins